MDELKPKFKKVFDKYDKDGNGYIDVEEVKEFIKKLGNHLVANVQGFDQMTEEQRLQVLYGMIQRIDKNQDNKVSWDEFWSFFSKNDVEPDESTHEFLDAMLK